MSLSRSSQYQCSSHKEIFCCFPINYVSVAFIVEPQLKHWMLLLIMNKIQKEERRCQTPAKYSPVTAANAAVKIQSAGKTAVRRYLF